MSSYRADNRAQDLTLEVPTLTRYGPNRMNHMNLFPKYQKDCFFFFFFSHILVAKPWTVGAFLSTTKSHRVATWALTTTNEMESR